MDTYHKIINEVKSQEEKNAIDRLFNMMQFLKSQMLLRMKLGDK